jgi:hypothetical protein
MSRPTWALAVGLLVGAGACFLLAYVFRDDEDGVEGALGFFGLFGFALCLIALLIWAVWTLVRLLTGSRRAR